MYNMPSYEQFLDKNTSIKDKVIKRRIINVYKNKNIRLDTGKLVSLNQIIMAIFNEAFCISNPSLIKFLYLNQFNQVSNYVMHYKGELGEFDYDTRDFKLYDTFGKDQLSYIGTEIDGRKIEIPKGINNCNYMFSGYKELIVAPKIPKGVINCKNMFEGCESLKVVLNIPKGVKNCEYMFEDCVSLEVAPRIPEGLENCEGMFRFCRSLRAVPNIPQGVKICTSMFSYCRCLEEVKEIPYGVEDCENMFKRCISLRRVPIIPSTVIHIRNIFENTNLNQDIIAWHLEHRGQSYYESFYAKAEGMKPYKSDN